MASVPPPLVVKLPMLMFPLMLFVVLLVKPKLWAPDTLPKVLVPLPLLSVLLPLNTTVPKLILLFVALIAPFKVVVLAVLVKPPVKVLVLASVTPFVFKRLVALVMVLLLPFKAMLYGCAKVVKPSKVVSPPKVTLPEALLAFFKVKVLDAPLKAPVKVILPLLLSIVASAVNAAGPVKVMLPLPDVTSAPI